MLIRHEPGALRRFSHDTPAMKITARRHCRPSHSWRWLPVLVASSLASATATVVVPKDFTSLSFEELGAIKVTSVSKKAERLFGIPASVSVLTGDDFLRFGAASFPEAIRMAAGTDVGQVDALQWAVSVRGFNDSYAQKLLVLRDGRSVYTPLFSGTFWQTQDAMLEDVDRIEVVKGPGGTVWGANAVNGVINIVSKSAKDTQGGLVSIGTRTDRPVNSAVRFGGMAGSQVYYRIYAKYDEGADLDTTAGSKSIGWAKRQAGFRADWFPSTSDQLTLQGDHTANQGKLLTPQITIPKFLTPRPALGYNGVRSTDADQTDSNVLGRWTRTFSDKSDMSVQGYYTHTTLYLGAFYEKRDTFDLDLRNRFQLGDRNEIVWGGGARESRAHVGGQPPMTIGPGIFLDRITNLFAQDEITIVPERLRWVVGAKLERNQQSGTFLEPGMRLAWTPTEQQTVWASVARAVRTPFLAERSGRIDYAVMDANPPLSPLPVLVTTQAGKEFENEILIAQEAGYRLRVNSRLTFDLAGYYNRYDKLRSTETRIDQSQVPNYVRLASEFTNTGSGRIYGSEITATWQPTDSWRLQGFLASQRSHFTAPVSPLSGTAGVPRSGSANTQASLRSFVDLTSQWSFAAQVRFVGEIAASGDNGSSLAGGMSTISSYHVFDVRLEWRPSRQFEISFGGHNLGPKHAEFAPTFISRDQLLVSPSYFAKVTWKY